MLAEDELKTQVGQRVYDLRSEAGLSHEELAKRAGIAPQTLVDVEAADCGDGALEILEKICFALGKQIRVGQSDSGSIEIRC